MASPLLPPVCLLANQMSLIDLEALQAHVTSLIKGLSPPPPELLTDAALRKQVIEMASSENKAFKAGWRKLVTKQRLVENVFGILEESYQPLRTKGNNPEGFKAARALGGRDTLEWQQFKLRVIQYLYSEGSFGNEKDGFSSYEDTAGGCDEVTWDAACYLLENPDWVHPPAAPVAPSVATNTYETEHQRMARLAGPRDRWCPSCDDFYTLKEGEEKRKQCYDCDENDSIAPHAAAQ